jgi:hypothetical protein
MDNEEVIKSYFGVWSGLGSWDHPGPGSKFS